MVERANKPSAISAPSSAPQPTVEIAADSSRVTALLPSGESVTVLLHGATVISWKAHGRENIFVSEKAALDGSKPVRGGIPIVFPVFGPPPSDHATSKLSQHGFARNSKWEYLGKSTAESGTQAKGAGDDCVKLDFGLGSASLSDEARKSWPHDFGLVYSVTLGKDWLQTMLNVSNIGSKPFEFQMLLHSYFQVDDISKTSITGLLGTSYIDKVLNASEHQEASSDLRITSEVDRVYKSIKQDTTTILVDGKPRLDVKRDNVADTVIWNPWREKAKAMSDFHPDEAYMKMVCVEIGTVDGWQTLEAGDTFEGGQILRSLP